MFPIVCEKIVCCEIFAEWCGCPGVCVWVVENKRKTRKKRNEVREVVDTQGFGVFRFLFRFPFRFPFRLSVRFPQTLPLSHTTKFSLVNSLCVVN